MSPSAIVQSVFLACAPARAFALFTEEAGAWWPPERRHTKDPASAIRMVAEGRFWERAADGHEVELGRVIAWEPPRRILLEWYPGMSADAPTEVTVELLAEGAGTRVRITHRPGRAGDLWAQRAPRFDASWALVLAAWQRAA